MYKGKQIHVRGNVVKFTKFIYANTYLNISSVTVKINVLYVFN